MKLARYVPARIAVGAGALALAGAAVLGTTVLGTAGPAAAATGTLRGSGTPARSPAESMAAWVSGPGLRYLNATEAAEESHDGRALARYAQLAAEHPQPADTAAYVTMMRWYGAAGTALSRGDARTAQADLTVADDMAWDVVQDTFAVLARIAIHR
jgi:hypothetical protein